MSVTGVLNYWAFTPQRPHVRSIPLLASQLLLLGVGGGHLQVEHWLQPGGASINPLTPLVIQKEDLDQASVHLLHFALPPGSLPLGLDDLSDL